MTIRQGDGKFDASEVDQTSVVWQMSQCKMWVSVVTLHRLVFVLWALQRLISPGLISSYLCKRPQFLLLSEAGGDPQKECSGTHTKAKLIDDCNSMKDNDFDSFSKRSS